jgi:hypothetical protein
MTASVRGKNAGDSSYRRSRGKAGNVAGPMIFSSQFAEIKYLPKEKIKKTSSNSMKMPYTFFKDFIKP